MQASHHRVVQLMGSAGQRGYVTMILRRHIPTVNSVAHLQNQQQTSIGQLPSPLQLQQAPQKPIQYPYDVVVARNEHEGFGFVIISASNQYQGSTIGESNDSEKNIRMIL